MSPEQCGMAGQHQHTHMDCRKRISWSAIVAGALVGIGLGFLLNLLCVALGFTFVATTHEGLLTFVLSGLIGLIIATFIMAFASGFTAGYLGRPYCKKQNLGGLYGFITWSVMLILGTAITPALSGYVSFYSNFITNPSMSIVVSPTVMKDPAAVSAPVAKAPAVKETKVVKTETAKPQAAGMHQVTSALSLLSTLVFILFLIGALSSMCGGRCGMRCNDQCAS